MKRSIGLLLSAMLMLGALAGCTTTAGESNTGAPVESVPAAGEESTVAPSSNINEAVWPRTVEDDLGHTITLEKKPERVIALYQGSIEPLFALGVPPIGAGDADEAMGGYATLKEYAATVDIVNIGDSIAPSMEKILELSPDLIIGTAVHSDAYDDLNKIAPTVLFEWDSWKDPLQKYAKCLGAEQEAEEYISEMDALTAVAREKLSGYNEKEFFAGWDRGKSMFAAFGYDSYELFYDSEDGLGLAAPKGYPESYEQISLEALAGYDPDYIFIFGSLGSQENDYAQVHLHEGTEDSTIWQSLKAVKSGNVFFLDVSAVNGTLGRRLAIDTVVENVVKD